MVTGGIAASSGDNIIGVTMNMTVAIEAIGTTIINLYAHARRDSAV